MKRIAVITLVLGCMTAAGAAAETAQLNLSLNQAVDQALRHSDRLQAKAFELEAFRSRASAQSSLLWPRLSFDATYRYQSQIPALQVFPALPAVELGARNNYSLGPTVAWSFFDSGGTYFAWRAAQAASRAKEDEWLALQREIRLQTRLAYFQTQMALAQVQLLSDQLHVSRVQYRDISNRTQAGQASRIDLLSAHQDVLSNQRQLRQTRTDLSSALRDLLNLTGGGEDLDLSNPAEVGTTPTAEAGPAPTVWLALDPLDQSLAKLEPAAHSQPDSAYPQVKMFLELADAGRRSADSIGSGYWPKGQVSFRSSLDYPNGPILETINQNTFAVNATWAYDFGRTPNQIAEQRHNAELNAKQAEQAVTDLQLNWQKAQDQVAQFRDLQAYDQQAVQETEELARLVYQSYRIGRSSYLEVQNANYRALGAKIQSVRTDVLLLIQLATLESMSPLQ